MAENEDVVFEDDTYEPEDPYADAPWGEQQREVDYLETRYESEPEPDDYDGPWED